MALRAWGTYLVVVVVFLFRVIVVVLDMLDARGATLYSEANKHLVSIG